MGYLEYLLLLSLVGTLGWRWTLFELWLVGLLLILELEEWRFFGWDVGEFTDFTVRWWVWYGVDELYVCLLDSPCSVYGCLWRLLCLNDGMYIFIIVLDLFTWWILAGREAGGIRANLLKSYWSSEHLNYIFLFMCLSFRIAWRVLRWLRGILLAWFLWGYVGLFLRVIRVI